MITADAQTRASPSPIQPSSTPPRPAPYPRATPPQPTHSPQKLLVGLRTRLLQCDAEHFGLDRSAELNPGVPVGMLNQVRAASTF